MTDVISRHNARFFDGLSRAPQISETARASALYPGLLEIARLTGLLLSLHEIGASAGLNLMADRFAHEIRQPRHGRSRLSGSTFAGNTRRVAGFARPPSDRPADRLLLRSYLWPDQPERMRRLDAAIAIAGQIRFSLIAADAADYVEQTLKSREPDRCHVLYHSVMWQYLPDDTISRIEECICCGGRWRYTLIAWLRMEGSGGVESHATLRLTMWPGAEPAGWRAATGAAAGSSGSRGNRSPGKAYPAIFRLPLQANAA